MKTIKNINDFIKDLENMCVEDEYLQYRNGSLSILYWILNNHKLRTETEIKHFIFAINDLSDDNFDKNSTFLEGMEASLHWILEITIGDLYE
jgi:hypothetical protein